MGGHATWGGDATPCARTLRARSRDHALARWRSRGLPGPLPGVGGSPGLAEPRSGPERRAPSDRSVRRAHVADRCGGGWTHGGLVRAGRRDAARRGNGAAAGRGVAWGCCPWRACSGSMATTLAVAGALPRGRRRCLGDRGAAGARRAVVSGACCGRPGARGGGGGAHRRRRCRGRPGAAPLADRERPAIGGVVPPGWSGRRPRHHGSPRRLGASCRGYGDGAADRARHVVGGAPGRVDAGTRRRRRGRRAGARAPARRHFPHHPRAHAGARQHPRGRAACAVRAGCALVQPSDMGRGVGAGADHRVVRE